MCHGQVTYGTNVVWSSISCHGNPEVNGLMTIPKKGYTIQLIMAHMWYIDILFVWPKFINFPSAIVESRQKIQFSLLNHHVWWSNHIFHSYVQWFNRQIHILMATLWQFYSLLWQKNTILIIGKPKRPHSKLLNEQRVISDKLT